MYLGHIAKVDIWLLFEPRDIWIGVYVKRPQNLSIITASWYTFICEVYVCIVPMFPFKFQWTRKRVKK